MAIDKSRRKTYTKSSHTYNQQYKTSVVHDYGGDDTGIIALKDIKMDRVLHET